MKEGLLTAYEWFKKVKVDLCEKDVEELKKKPNVLELRYAIYCAERRKNELLGKIHLMEAVGVIGRKGYEEEEKELEELFSPKRLFDAEINPMDGQLILYASEIKKRAKKSGTFLSPVDSGRIC